MMSRVDETRTDGPARWLVRLGCLVSLYLALLGDMPDLNRAVGGAPKILSMGVVGVALLHLFIVGDFKQLGRTLRFAPIFFLLILTLMLWSLVVWMLSFTTMSSVTRGFSKLLYQSITIANALACCYLLEEEAIAIFFAALCMANGSIMVLTVPKYGLGPSISSLVHCIVTFGDAKGYIKDLELHDITFTFGQCLIYWTMFADRRTVAARRKRRLSIGLCLFFMLVGLKRATFFAVALMCVLVLFLRRRKRPAIWVGLIAVGMFFGAYLYIWVVRQGIFTELLHMLNVDMLGRDEMWTRTNAYYEFSPLYMGRGFEAVSSIIAEWVSTGVMRKSLPFHNDYLKAFVELGFGGFTLWHGIQTLLYPTYWARRHGTEPMLLYISIFAYMSITYLTDNTSFYFWSSTALRLLPMAYAMGRGRRHVDEATWVAPDAQRIADDVWQLEQEELNANE